MSVANCISLDSIPSLVRQGSHNAPRAPITTSGANVLNSLTPQSIGVRMLETEAEEIRRLVAAERAEREQLARELRDLRERFEVWCCGKGGGGGGEETGTSRVMLLHGNSPESAGNNQDQERLGERDEDAGSDTDPRDLAAVTRKRLDIGDAYAPNMSIWDAVLFVGHHCLGPVVSIALILIWSLNIVFQAWFCAIVQNNMLLADVTDVTLKSLLRWRIGVAHHIEFADPVTQRSMAAQICSEDGKLHMSAAQAAVFDNIDDFQNGGVQLMLLAQFIWVCTILKEVNDTFSFARGLYNIGSGSKTRIIMTESDPHPQKRQMVRTPTGSLVSLITLMMVTRVTSLSRVRFSMAMGFIVVPRLAIACTLGYVGVRFLAKTSKMEDLVLNAIALAFVCDIDELFFKVFGPRRSHCLMENLEGFPMPHRKGRKLAGLFAMFKFILVSTVIIIVYFLLVEPFAWRLEQANHLLCTGEIDFVYAVNQATGMVHVTRSRSVTSSDNLTYEEKILLQVAAPTIDADGPWQVDDEIINLSISDFTQAVVEPTARSLNAAEFSEDYFMAVRQLEDSTGAEAAADLSCVDLASGQSRDASLVHLQQIVNDSNVTSCDNVKWSLCSRPDMTELRAICPARCACDQPPRYTRALSGFFQSAEGGCPSQCGILTATRNEVKYMTASVGFAMGRGRYSCSDVEASEFAFEESCVDTDQFSRAEVALHQVCPDGKKDVDRCSHDYDDTGFTAAHMCCECGGGRKSDVGSSIRCLHELTSSCLNMDLVAFWWVIYVHGLFSHLYSQTKFNKNVEKAIKHDFNIVRTSDPSVRDALVAHVQNGSFRESFVDGKWMLMPGLPHPRNLTGCDYLASFEIKALLNLDLCSPDSFRSIRFLCPEACGCTPKAYKPSGDPAVSGTYDEVDFLTFSKDRSQLDQCPAGCLLAHPDISGIKAFDNWDSDKHLGADEGDGA